MTTESGEWSAVQRDWETPLHGDAWGKGPDNRYLLGRLWHLPADIVALRPGGRVLDIGAAQCVHATDIASRGFSCVALEPAPTMLADARRRIEETRTAVSLVRGFAEALPFADGSFDQVMCHSAVDHFAEPDRCIREMTRVLKRDGRLIFTFVNYGGLSVRLSRAYYAVDGLFRRVPRSPHWFWETPVPHEHSFECTLPRLRDMCRQYLEPQMDFGISLGWQMPGWGWLLEHTNGALTWRILEALDRMARRFPAAADVVVSIWRPRPPAQWRPRVCARGAAGLPTTSFRVSAADPAYGRLAGEEESYRPSFADSPIFAAVLAGYSRMSNRSLTGDPERSWMDDFTARAPAGRAAVLGLDGTRDLVAWRRARPDTPVDVFDLSPGALAAARRALAAAGLDRDVHFERADLNFLELRAHTYDVIWSSGCLHHVLNLELLLERVAVALTAGGVFAVNDYVGESRRQFAPQRLERLNRLLAAVPSHLRRDPHSVVHAPTLDQLSPFCGARSEEIPALLREHFTALHEVRVGFLFPLELHLDIARMESEAPEWIETLLAEEAAMRCEPGSRPTLLYGIYAPRC